MLENPEQIKVLVKSLAQNGSWDKAREECNFDSSDLPECIVTTENFAKAVRNHTYSKYVLGYLRSVEFLASAVEILQQIIESGETKEKLMAIRILRQIHRDLADAGFLLNGQLKLEAETTNDNLLY